MGGLDQKSLAPITLWEFPFFTALNSFVAWYVTTYWTERATQSFQSMFNCLYCCCCCFCTGVGCGGGDEAGGEGDTLLLVADAVSDLTGADVDATSKITEIGLDSFGSGALVGVLKARIPDLPLTAVDVSNME